MTLNVYAAEREKFDLKTHAIEAQKEIDKNNSEIDEIIKTWKITMTPEESLKSKGIAVKKHIRSKRSASSSVGSAGDILVTPVRIVSGDTSLTGHAAIVDNNSNYSIKCHFCSDGIMS